jgi:hypothetical protein
MMKDFSQITAFVSEITRFCQDWSGVLRQHRRRLQQDFATRTVGGRNEPRADSGHVEPPLPFVMAGLVPAIHAFLVEGRKQNVDARDKRGHDEKHGVI